MNPVPFLPAAERELESYARFYEAEAGRGKDFLQAMEAAIRRIGEAPGQGTAYLHGTRRLVVFRYPFSIVYVLELAGPLIVALAHHRRKPDYWVKRLSSRKRLVPPQLPDSSSTNGPR